MKIRDITLLVFCFLLSIGFSFAQNKTYITVKGNDLNSWVVILNVQVAGKDYLLQCNQGAPGCAVLKNGRYQLVELPKDFGMYECRNVEIYAEAVMPSDAMKPEKPGKPNKDDKLGEYCLVEKPT
jgi:hypothetical protein